MTSLHTKCAIRSEVHLAALTEAGNVVSARGFVVPPVAEQGARLTDARIARHLALKAAQKFAARPDATMVLASVITGTHESAVQRLQPLIKSLAAGALEGRAPFRPPQCAFIDPIYRGAARVILFPPEARAITLLRCGEPPAILLSPKISFCETLTLTQICLSDAIVECVSNLGIPPAPGDAAARLTWHISGTSAPIAPPTPFTYAIGGKLWQGIART